MMIVQYYTPGNKGTLRLENIYEEDEKFIQDNNLTLTLEELPVGEFAIYLKGPDDKEEDETIELAKGRNCNDTIASLVQMYKRKHSCH